MIKDCVVVIDPFSDPNDVGDYDWLFKKYAGNISHNPKDIARAKLVVFTGGEDVDPSLYSQKALKHTYSDIQRDEREKAYYQLATHLQVPMTGICRGAQFLCVMTGGTLYQNVYNHWSGNHQMSTMDGRTLEVNTLHHQMMNPKTNDIILGWSKNISNRYETYTATYSNIGKEPEAVQFQGRKIFAVQYHPEYLDEEHEAVKFYREHLERICGL